jgi:hypothetical protein
MIRGACLVATFAATAAFAQQNDVRGCESESNSDRQFESRRDQVVADSPP